MNTRLFIMTNKKRVHWFRILTDTLRREFGIECMIHTPPTSGSHYLSLKRVRNLMKFRKTVREFDPDFIILDGGFHLWIRAAIKNIPLLIILRGDLWTERQWIRHPSNPLARLNSWWNGKLMVDMGLKKAAAILPVSDYLADVTRRYLPDSRILTLPISMDSAYWDSSKVAKPVMNLKHPCVGLLQTAEVWGKTEEMIRVLPDIARALPNVTFYWAGNGTYRNQVIDAMSGCENFEPLGTLRHPDQVRQYLAEIDIFALVSGLDMMPEALLESSLMERPIISTRIGGTPEIIQDGKTGFLVERGDIDGWIKCISGILKRVDGGNVPETGKNARTFVSERFDPGRIAQRLAEILGEVGHK